MAKPKSTDPLLPSILDRLIDHAPDESTEPTWSQSVREIKQCVSRDLEALLNARQTRWDLPEDYDELHKSVLTYGLPDFTGGLSEGGEQRKQIKLAVEMAIQMFEPRLTRVNVTVHSDTHSYERNLRFSIDAVLMVHPNPEPVTFDTIVEPHSGDCQVNVRA